MVHEQMPFETLFRGWEQTPSVSRQKCTRRGEAPATSLAALFVTVLKEETCFDTGAKETRTAQMHADCTQQTHRMARVVLLGHTQPKSHSAHERLFVRCLPARKDLLHHLRVSAINAATWMTSPSMCLEWLCGT